MKDLYKEFNDRFNNKKLPNENFDTEGLWADIAEELNDQSSDKKPGFPYKKILPLLVFFIICIVAITSYFSFEQEQKIIVKNNTSQDNKTTSSHNGTDSNNEQTNNSTYQSSVINNNTTQNTDAKNTDNRIETTTDKINNQNKTLKDNKNQESNARKIKTPTTNYSNNTLKKGEITTSNNLDITSKYNKSKTPASKTSSSKDFTSIKKNQNSNIKDAQKTNPEEDTNKVYKKQNNEILPQLNTVKKESNSLLATDNFILPLPLIPMSSESLTSNQTPKIKRIIYPTNTRIINWQIEALVGVNKLNLIHTGSNPVVNTLKENTEKGIYGQSIGLHLSGVYKNNFLFTSGVEIHNNWTRLKFNEGSIQMIPQKNISIDATIDQLTGKVSAQIEDTLVANTQQLTRVIHHNNLRTISIPVLLGYQKNHHQWIFGIRGGVAFNFTTQQDGKTFDEEAEITNYSKGDNLAPFKSFQVSFRANPFIGYRLTKNWTAMINPSWSVFPSRQLGTSDISLGIRQWSFNVGINYRFYR